MLHSFDMVSQSEAPEAKRLNSWLQESSKDREVMLGGDVKKEVLEVLRYVSKEMNEYAKTGFSDASTPKVRLAEDTNREQSEVLSGIGACFDS